MTGVQGADRRRVESPTSQQLKPVMAGLINVDATGGIREGAGAGLMVTVLDEVAKRAGFTWRNSYAVFADPELSGKTWTELVKWQISSYDLSGEWWVSSHARTRTNTHSVTVGAHQSSNPPTMLALYL